MREPRPTCPQCKEPELRDVIDAQTQKWYVTCPRCGYYVNKIREDKPL